MEFHILNTDIPYKLKTGEFITIKSGTKCKVVKIGEYSKTVLFNINNIEILIEVYNKCLS